MVEEISESITFRAPSLQENPNVGITDANVIVSQSEVKASLTLTGEPIRVYSYLWPATAVAAKTEKELFIETVMTDGRETDGTGFAAETENLPVGELYGDS